MSTQIYPSESITVSAIVSTSGLSTEAKQDTQITLVGSTNTKLDTISGKIPALGQATMAASLPVAIASNQGAISAKLQDGGGTAVTSQANGSARALDVGINVSGVQVDPRVIRALTNSDIVKAQLQDNSGNAITLGQAAMAASLPVTIANNQSALSVSLSTLSVVDQIDTTPLLDVSLSNIPASASSSLSIVASLAAAVKKVVTVEDIGEFIGLYSGLVSSPTLLCILPLGGGEIEVSIPAGTLVSIRHMKNSAITSGYMAINFLG